MQVQLPVENLPTHPQHVDVQLNFTVLHDDVLVDLGWMLEIVTTRH